MNRAKIVFPTDVRFQNKFPTNFPLLLSVLPGIKSAEPAGWGMRWPAVLSWHDQKHRQGRRPGSWQLQPLNKNLFLECVTSRLYLCPRTPQLCHASDTPRDTAKGQLLFPRIPPFPHKVCTHGSQWWFRAVYRSSLKHLLFSTRWSSEEKCLSAGFNLWRI